MASLTGYQWQQFMQLVSVSASKFSLIWSMTIFLLGKSIALEVTAMQGFFRILFWDALSFWALFSQCTDKRRYGRQSFLNVDVLMDMIWKFVEALPSWTDEHLLRGSRALAPSSRWAHREKAPAARQEVSSPQWEHAGFSGSVRNKPLLFISYPCYGTLL